MEESSYIIDVDPECVTDVYVYVGSTVEIRQGGANPVILFAEEAKRLRDILNTILEGTNV